MALGSQWYILFNVIAGASANPYRATGDGGPVPLPLEAEMAGADPARNIPVLRDRGHHRRTSTAWNASIVAEIVTYGKHHLLSTGLGAYIAQARAILRALETTKDGTLSERFFLDLLRGGFSQDEAQAQLDTAIDWGRYGELFDYRANDGELILTPADTMAA